MDTQYYLDDAAQKRIQVDLQAVLLELTTRLMGSIAYNVRVTFSLNFRNDLLIVNYDLDHLGLIYFVDGYAFLPTLLKVFRLCVRCYG